jgi:hypothetical protein
VLVDVRAFIPQCNGNIANGSVKTTMAEIDYSREPFSRKHNVRPAHIAMNGKARDSVIICATKLLEDAYALLHVSSEEAASFVKRTAQFQLPMP